MKLFFCFRWRGWWRQKWCFQQCEQKQLTILHLWLFWQWRWM